MRWRTCEDRIMGRGNPNSEKTYDENNSSILFDFEDSYQANTVRQTINKIENAFRRWTLKGGK